MLVRHTLSWAVVAMLSGATAHADNPHLDAETFRPSPHAGDVLATITSDVREAGAWRLGAMLSYSRAPLVFVDLTEQSPDQEAVAHQLALHALGAISATDWLSVGLELPVFLWLDGDDEGFVPVAPVPSSALGDLRLSAKIAIVRRAEGEDGLGLGIELPLSVPTGDGDAFVSDGWSFAPALAIDLRAGDLRVAVNLGGRLRSTETLAQGTEIGPEVLFRVAASYALLPGVLALDAEVQGASHDFSQSNDTYVEGLIGGRFMLGDGFELQVAGGRGFATGYGSTAARAVLGLAYAPERYVEPPPPPAPSDSDGDHIVDPDDRCPHEPEDQDGFEDADGCPDPDNDGDGIVDLADGVNGACANQPEDKDGFQDEDGCPDPDNDGDGIADAQDDCPLDPTNKCGVKYDPCEIHIDQKVYFAYNKAEILPESFAILDAVAALVMTHDTVKLVEVQGHTDNTGADDYNLRLSQLRAESVVAYLQGKGVAPGRLSAKGYGMTRPIVENRGESGRSKNRRVQFIILDPVQTECTR